MFQVSNRTKLAGAAIALLVVGAGAGSALTHELSRPRVMAPGAPIKIAALAGLPSQGWGEPIATVRGRISEVYGDSFVLDDGSGKVLIRAGRRHAPLAVGQDVGVQGGVENGTLDARYLIGSNGVAYAVGRHHDGHGGERHGRGRDEHEFESPPVPSHAEPIDTAPTAAPSSHRPSP